MADKEVKVSAKTYSVLLRPIITEKSSLLNEQGKVAFEIAKSATKGDVKSAVEALYKVGVKGVNIVNRPGKTKRFKGIVGRTSDIKKAYVTLADGAKIDIMAEVK
ncbi:MAG: 50S ribosomal protein L23 [Rickettsiales bacterium]|jgi:large subunit ribosomal protein L23|nr:50S ribosomal protein L23 [Rickettsiales bacterium]